MGNPFDVFGWHVTWGSWYALNIIESVLMFLLGYRFTKWTKR
jgi:hypothetical protein